MAKKKEVSRRRRGGTVEYRSNRPGWKPKKGERVPVLGTRGRVSVPEIPGFVGVMIFAAVLIVIAILIVL